MARTKTEKTGKRVNTVPPRLDQYISPLLKHVAEAAVLASKSQSAYNLCPA